MQILTTKLNHWPFIYLFTNSIQNEEKGNWEVVIANFFYFFLFGIWTMVRLYEIQHGRPKLQKVLEKLYKTLQNIPLNLDTLRFLQNRRNASAEINIRKTTLIVRPRKHPLSHFQPLAPSDVSTTSMNLV